MSVTISRLNAVVAGTTARQRTNAHSELGNIQTVHAAVRHQGGKAFCVYIHEQSVVIESQQGIAILQKLYLCGKGKAVRKIQVCVNARGKGAFKVLVHVQRERSLHQHAANALGQKSAQLFHKVGKVVAHIGKAITKVHVKANVYLIQGGDIFINGARSEFHGIGEHVPLFERYRNIGYAKLHVRLLIRSAACRGSGGIKGDLGTYLNTVLGADIYFTRRTEIDHGFGVLIGQKQTEQCGEKLVRQKHGELIPKVNATQHISQQLHDLARGKRFRGSFGGQGGRLTFRGHCRCEITLQRDLAHKIGNRGTVSAVHVHKDGTFVGPVLTVPNRDQTVAFGQVARGRIGPLVNRNRKLNIGKL